MGNTVLLFMRNGRYCLIFHEKTIHAPYKIQIYRTVTLKHWKIRTRSDKLQKRPVRFLVALNTLDNFYVVTHRLKDVTSRFGSVL